MKDIPQYLYKYRVCKKNAFENLKAGVVWCSTLDKFNDPYEGYTTIDCLMYCKAWLNKKTKNRHTALINSVKNDEELIKVMPKILPGKLYNKEWWERKKQGIKKIFNEFRDENIKNTFICSFAHDRDNRLMWGHYAKDHTGFCIQYETKQIQEYLYEVNYNEEIYDLTDELIENMNSGEDKESNKMALRKDEIWSYEKEWRLINPPVEKEKIKEEGYPFNLKASAIFLGTKISKRSSNKLRDIAEEQNLIVNKMVMDDENYQLKYETINKHLGN